MEKDLKRQTHVVYSAEEVLQQVEVARASTESIIHKIHLFAKNASGLGVVRWDEDIELHEPGGLWDRIMAFITGVSPIEAGLRRLELTEQEIRSFKVTLQKGGFLVVKEYYSVADDEEEQPIAGVAGDQGGPADEVLVHHELAADLLSNSNDDCTGDALDKAMLMDAEYTEQYDDGFQTNEPIFKKLSREMYISKEMYEEALAMNDEYDAMKHAKVERMEDDKVKACGIGAAQAVDDAMYYEAYAMNEAFNRERKTSGLGYASHDLGDIMERRSIDSMQEVQQVVAGQPTLYSNGYDDLSEAGDVSSEELAVDDAMYDEAYAMNAAFDEERAGAPQMGEVSNNALNVEHEAAAQIDDEMYDEAYAMNVEYDAEREGALQMGEVSNKALNVEHGAAPQIDDAMYEEAYAMNAAFDEERGAGVIRLSDEQQFEAESMDVGEPIYDELIEQDDAPQMAYDIDEAMYDEAYAMNEALDVERAGALQMGEVSNKALNVEHGAAPQIDDAMYEEAYAMNAAFDEERGAGVIRLSDEQQFEAESMDVGEPIYDELIEQDDAPQMAYDIDEAMYEEAYAMNAAFDEQLCEQPESLHSTLDEQATLYMGDVTANHDVLNEKLSHTNVKPSAIDDELHAEALAMNEQRASNVTPLPLVTDKPKLWNENGDPLSIYNADTENISNISPENEAYLAQTLMVDEEKDEPIPSDLVRAEAEEEKFITDETAHAFDVEAKHVEMDCDAPIDKNETSLITLQDDPQMHFTTEDEAKTFSSYVQDETSEEIEKMRTDDERPSTYLAAAHSLETAQLEVPTDEMNHMSAVASDKETGEEIELTEWKQLFFKGEQVIAFTIEDEDETPSHLGSGREEPYRSEHIPPTHSIELENGYPKEHFEEVEQLISSQDNTLYNDDTMQAMGRDDWNDEVKGVEGDQQLLSTMYKELFGEDIVYKDLKSYEDIKQTSKQGENDKV